MGGRPAAGSADQDRGSPPVCGALTRLRHRNFPKLIRAFFSERAKAEGIELRTLFRDGRRAFAIGIALIAVFVTAAWRLTLYFEGTLITVLQESLLVIAWVIIWRPAEMFLYDWVPIARRRKLFRRLADATVTGGGGADPLGPLSFRKKAIATRACGRFPPGCIRLAMTCHERPADDA